MRPLIVLIGPRGSGKTTLGRVLADRLGWTFVDTDDVAQARLGVPIATLFAAGREPEFRAAEAAVVREALAADRAVVATGGGAVLAPATREALAGVFVAWLHAPDPVLVERIAGTARPPLTDAPPAVEVTRIGAERRPLYAACATFTLDTSCLPVDDAAAAVERAWLEHALHHDLSSRDRGSP